MIYNKILRYVHVLKCTCFKTYMFQKCTSFKMYMFGVVGETHAHDYFEVISFYNSKDIKFSDTSLLVYYVTCVISLSKKLKYLKNEARESKTER